MLRVPKQNLSAIDCIAIIWWSSGIRKQQPMWLMSEKRKVFAIAILPGKPNLNLLQKLATFCIFFRVSSKFTCKLDKLLSIFSPNTVIEFFTLSRWKLSSSFIDLFGPTGITQVLLKLQWSPEILEKSINIFFTTDMFSRERSPSPYVSSANPSTLSVSCADSFLNFSIWLLCKNGRENGNVGFRKCWNTDLNWGSSSNLNIGICWQILYCVGDKLSPWGLPA